MAPARSGRLFRAGLFPASYPSADTLGFTLMRYSEREENAMRMGMGPDRRSRSGQNAFASLALIVMLMSTSAARAIAVPQSTELDGVWVAESMERDGVAVVPQAVANLRFTFAGQILSHRGLIDPRRTDQSPLVLDESKRPKHLSFTTAGGGKVLAIYELKGDILTLYFYRKGSERPSNFKVPSDAGSIFLVLKKQSG